jgi:hypothetical protein
MYSKFLLCKEMYIRTWRNRILGDEFFENVVESMEPFLSDVILKLITFLQPQGADVTPID